MSDGLRCRGLVGGRRCPNTSAMFATAANHPGQPGPFCGEGHCSSARPAWLTPIEYVDREVLAARYPKPDCASPPVQLHSEQRMAEIDLDDLRAKGVTRAAFHPDGSLASVEFGPLATPAARTADTKHDEPKGPPKRMSATGGLVRRGDDGNS